MNPVPSVLVVRPGALGDTILSLPFVYSLMRRFPGSKITFLGNPAYRTLFPKETVCESIDDPKWTWMFMPTDSELHDSSKFDCAYVYLKRPDRPARNLLSAGVRQVVTASSDLPHGVHVVEHMHRSFKLAVPRKNPVLSRLAGSRKDILWIHPGSGGSGKCLPLKFIMEYAGAVAKQCNLRQVVTIGEADAFLKADPYWTELWSNKDVIMIENKTVLELCSGLGGAALYIGHDSGISHLAAALGIKSIVFFVATDPKQWMPWVPEPRIHLEDARIGHFDASDPTPRIPSSFLGDCRAPNFV